MKKILLTIIALIVVCSAEITDAQNVFATNEIIENVTVSSEFSASPDFNSTTKELKATEMIHTTHNGFVAPATLAHLN